MKKWLADLFAPRGRTVRRPRRTRLQVDQLESRLVPATTLSLSGSTLTVVGNGADDGVTITTMPFSNDISVNHNGVVKNYDEGVVRKIVFRGGDGDDNFRNVSAIPLVADGGAGNDTLLGG